jgi:hypothetical protein
VAIHTLLVMPGLDPGTPTTAGIRADHRVKPGDDDGEEWRLGRNNSPPDPYPDAYGAWTGHNTEENARRQGSDRSSIVDCIFADLTAPSGQEVPFLCSTTIFIHGKLSVLLSLSRD